MGLASVGAFDSLNPYNAKALTAAEGLIGNVFQSLMYRSADEPFTLYGLIARESKTTLRAISSSFISTLARAFSDGTLITSADVLFTFHLLEKKAGRRCARPMPRSDGRNAGSLYRALRSFRRQRPRTAADAGADAGALARPSDAERFEEQTLDIPSAPAPTGSSR